MQVPGVGSRYGLVGALKLAANEAEQSASRTGSTMEAIRLRTLATTLRAEARGLQSMEARGT